MQGFKDPLKTTVKGLFSNKVPKTTVVKRINEKIMLHGVCSDSEMEYLRTHTDWDRVNPRRAGNLG